MTGSDSSLEKVAPPARGQFANIAFLLLCGIAIGGIAVLYGLRFMASVPVQIGPTPAAIASADSAALARRLDAAEARIALLEKSPVSAANVGLLSARVDRLEQAPNAQLDLRLGAAEGSLAALRKDFDTRVGTLEREDTSVALQRAATALALANLVRASDAGTPFAREFSSLRALMPDSGEVRDLARYAASGAPSEAVLADRFSQTASEAIAAERAAHAGGWLGRVWANIANLVVIRRVGETKGRDTQSRLARAGALLKAHDLAAAIVEMHALSGPAARAAAPWLAQAEARLAVDRDMRALGDRLVHDLAQNAGPAAGHTP